MYLFFDNQLLDWRHWNDEVLNTSKIVDTNRLASRWLNIFSAMIHRGKKYDVRNKTISFSIGQINDWIKTKDGNLTLEIRHTQRTIGDAMKAANIYFHEQQIKPTPQIESCWLVAHHYNIATVHLTDALNLIKLEKIQNSNFGRYIESLQPQSWFQTGILW